MPEAQMRAADADREAVVRRLGEHMAAGRLTLAEYEQRSAGAYAARTYGELAELTTDLPGPAAAGTPTPSSTPATAPTTPRPVPAAGACAPWGWGGMHGWSRTAAWGSWASTALIVTAIWLFTSIASGGLLYFWPIWVVGPWGAVLLAQSLGAGPRPGRRERERHRLPR